jgi:CRP/FNR family transcriptional regulator, nitrogen oxide reductase regulator
MEKSQHGIERIEAPHSSPAQRPGFGTAEPGDHIIVIYEEAAEGLAFVTRYIAEGLAKGERCIYIIGDFATAEVTQALVAERVDVDHEIARGALAFLTAQEFYALPPFDPLQTVALLQKRLARPNSPGFAGVRIAGGMTWTRELSIPDDPVEEYESLLNMALGPGAVTAACLYRRDLFSLAFLQRLIRNHAKVVADDSVYLILSGLFQNLARTDLQKMLRAAGDHRRRKGEFFFRQGDPANEMFVLTAGKVKLVRADDEGRGVIFRIVSPAEPFGEDELGETPRAISAQTLEDSRALVWDAATIVQVMMDHPVVAVSAVRLMATYIRKQQGLLLEVAASRVERRLARLLLRFARSMGHKTLRGIAIELPLLGQDLADMAISTPYTVSRLLARWKRLGIIDGERERILILDEGDLAAIAGVRVEGTLDVTEPA